MSNLSQSIAELKTLVGQCGEELTSLQSGKKASAPRCRASLQKIKTLSHTMRAGVMEFTKEMPVKSRTKKAATTSDAIESDESDENIPPPPVLKREQTEKKKGPAKDLK